MQYKLLYLLLNFHQKNSSATIHELIYIFDGIPKFLVVLKSYMLKHMNLFMFNLCDQLYMKPLNCFCQKIKVVLMDEA
jgi:hypothetical protein